MKIDSPAMITVYPEFCLYRRKCNIQDGPWLCEDDHGGIAFVSEEMKQEYLERTPHEVHATRR